MKNKKEKAVINDLTERGKRDGNPNEPKFPSAQLWALLSPEAQVYLKETVIQLGGDWETYEREMKKHWPMETTTMVTIENIKRQK